MATVTIPRKITKGEELVIISRKEFEKLFGFLQKKKQLDKDLKKALEEVRSGKAIGPFSEVKDLIKSLEK